MLLARLLLVVASISWGHSASLKARKALASFGLSLSVYLNGPASINIAGFGVGVQPVLAKDDASSTFANAEKAMKLTYENFDLANKAWINGAKRMLSDNVGIVNEKKKMLQTATSELTASSTAMSGLLADMKTFKDQVASEITTLQLSTASSYEIAQAAADAGKRPAITAGLFKTAQNGADTIVQDEIVLKEIVSLIDKIDSMDSKLKDVVKNLNGHVEDVISTEEVTAKSTISLETAIQGLQSLEIRGDGLVPVSSSGGGPTISSSPGADTSKPLSGAALFKKGASIIDTEQKKVWTTLKKVQSDSRTANNVGSDIVGTAAAAADTVEKQDLWEADTKLKNPIAKASVKQAKSKIESVVKIVTNSIKRLDTFNDEVNNVYSSSDKQKDKSKKQRKAVNALVPSLKDIANKLETYESKSRETDNLLQKAAEAGRKESEKFAKFRKSATIQ